MLASIVRMCVFYTTGQSLRTGEAQYSISNQTSAVPVLVFHTDSDTPNLILFVSSSSNALPSSIC